MQSLGYTPRRRYKRVLYCLCDCILAYLYFVIYTKEVKKAEYEIWK